MVVETVWGMLALLILGTSTVLSPCSGPLLFSTLPFIIRGRSGSRGIILCFLTVFLVFFGVGILVVAAGYLLDTIYLLRYVVAVALILLGAGIILGLRVYRPLLTRPIGGKGVVAICAGYALFSSQCNLPLIAGAVLFLVSGVGAYDRVLSLIVYTLGASLPLLIILTLSNRFSRIQGIARRAASASVLLERISGIVLVGGGLVLLLS